MKIAVGMSGGVDSSTVAFLLKKEGHDVVGLFMKNWDEEDEICPAKQDYEDALRVADELQIPLYTLNFSKTYWDRVFTKFIEEIKLGYTPNPDIWCNQEIKFSVLFDKAFDIGVDALATGHYAGVSSNFELLRGKDQSKDQSYFLYTLKREKLQKILFPLGEMEKTHVRLLAEGAKLATAKKKDSTGICFIGKRNFKGFIEKYIAPRPGVFKTEDGKVVGHHDGAYYYTIGQRKGLGIGGAGDAWFVSAKDIKTQEVTVVQGIDHPSLLSLELSATDLSFVGEQPTLPYRCSAKIRYRQNDAPCTIERIENGRAFIRFDTPQRAITPRQAIVFYQNEVCLGGGLIAPTGCF